MTGIIGPQPDDGNKRHQVRAVEPRPHDTPPVKEQEGLPSAYPCEQELTLGCCVCSATSPRPNDWDVRGSVLTTNGKPLPHVPPRHCAWTSTFRLQPAATHMVACPDLNLSVAADNSPSG
eukprot:3635077-Rhodomonas_salina.1